VTPRRHWAVEADRLCAESTGSAPTGPECCRPGSMASNHRVVAAFLSRNRMTIRPPFQLKPARHHHRATHELDIAFGFWRTHGAVVHHQRVEDGLRLIHVIENRLITPNAGHHSLGRRRSGDRRFLSAHQRARLADHILSFAVMISVAMVRFGPTCRRTSALQRTTACRPCSPRRRCQGPVSVNSVEPVSART
jgi:hypothetical protein